MPAPPLMGQLPKSRVQATYPFETVGMDYFGPYTVAIGRRTEKRYGVMFTCHASRAVHLEIAEDLSASEAINCLTRFINFRGRPKEIWSDNGTNFVGARKEMEEAKQSLESKEVQEFLSVREISWKFLVASSPHMGGAHERMIGSVKKVLAVILKTKNPRESVLRTLFSEVCNILNSRPLTYASPDPNDPECLTPNHILRLQCIPGQTIPGDYDDNEYRRSWRYAQRLADKFWEEWTKQYLPWLAKRQKWHKKVEPLQIGDLVLLLDDQAKRNSWKKGLVTEVDLAKDGQVRSAKVKVCYVDAADKKKVVKTTILHRPAVKLCKLSTGSGKKSVAFVGENVPESTGKAAECSVM